MGRVVHTGPLFTSTPTQMYGNTVVIEHNLSAIEEKGLDPTLYPGFSIFTLYAHLSDIAVSTGDWVEGGNLIGIFGQTGNSFGSHLHLGHKYNGYIVREDNGYAGFSDSYGYSMYIWEEPYRHLPPTIGKLFYDFNGYCGTQTIPYPLAMDFGKVGGLIDLLEKLNI